MHGTLATLPPEASGFTSHGLELWEVGNDSMRPTVDERDMVLAAPAEKWAGEGLYVFRLNPGPPPFAPRMVSCYRCWGERRDGKRVIALSRDNPLYWRDGKVAPDYVSEEWFRENVLGKVVVHCRVLDHERFRRAA